MTLQSRGSVRTDTMGRHHHARARAWKITPPSVTETFRLTTLQFPATLFDGLVYSPLVSAGGAVIASARRRESDLSDASSQIEGILVTDLIDDEFVRSGRLRNAVVEEYLIDWRWPWRHPLETTRYEISDTESDQDAWNVELQTLAGLLGERTGDNWGPDCRVDLFSQGAGKCNLLRTLFAIPGINPEDPSTIGTDLQDPYRMVIVNPSNMGGVPWDQNGAGDDGQIEFTAGPMSGLVFDVKASFVDTPIVGRTTLTFQEPLPRDLQLTDLLTLSPCCNKQSGRFSPVGHCKHRFNNLENFQGEDTIVGRDRTQKGIPIQG